MKSFTKTEKKIINHIGLNQNRNRKLTRNKLARELKVNPCLIYGSSNDLERRGFLVYKKINKVESIISLSFLGNEIFLKINSGVTI